MSWAARGLSATVGLVSLAFAGWLAAHHPVSPTTLAAAGVGVAVLVASRFGDWPLWLLPLLPLAGLAPWTGWLVAEEWDVFVLAAAAGGYLRVAALPRRPANAPGTVDALGPWMLLLPLAVLTGLAAVKGVQDAGGLSFGWWQGYHEPLNALRLAKPVLAVLLLLPLWQALVLRHGEAAWRTLLLAMVALAVTASLPVWSERAAFPGLTNMSTDYRATGSFWEMHVGGAALDAVLSLSAPFALYGLLAARRPAAMAAAAVAFGLVLYAALATFSRIVYIAVPLALLVCGFLRVRQGAGLEFRAWAWALCLPALLVAGTWWLFPVAGYRGVGALLGCFALMLPVMAADLKTRVLTLGLGVGVLVAVGVWVSVIALPKGAYVAFGVLWVLAALVVALGGQAGAGARALAFAAFLGCLSAFVGVSWHWGGGEAGWRATWLAAGILAIGLVAGTTSALSWPTSLRWQVPVIVCGIGLVAASAVFLGGAYMADRATTMREDGLGRKRHWAVLLDQLGSLEQQLFGRGLGRTPIHLANSGIKELTIGDARLVDAGGQSALRMLSGPHTQGWGEMLRLSQRIERPKGAPLKLRMRIRSETPISVHVEVCDKHLLYDGVCQIGQRELAKPTPQWLELEIPLGTDRLRPGSWYAPRSVVFSLALDYRGARAEVDGLQLLDIDGRDLLNNGSFEDGLARWFLTSDRHHMPWHAKNLAVHLWFEQGFMSLTLLSMGVLALAVRVLGKARYHPLAPPVAGAIVGVAVVGMVDSVFDIPRAAFLTLWLLAVGLSLPYTRPPSRAELGSN